MLNKRIDASPDVLADLWLREDTLSSKELARYARETHGLTPPDTPVGAVWDIGVRFPPDGPDDGVLYWLGPDPEELDGEGYGEL